MTDPTLRLLQPGTPEQCGLEPARWRTVCELADLACRTDDLPGLAVLVGRSGRTLGPLMCGRQHLSRDSETLRDDAIFLVASITKPIVAMATMLLVERGRLTLNDRVAQWVEGFSAKGRNGIRIRHLLTHTSGLPDMLPNNRELREQHAELPRFLEGARHCELEFPAGRGVRYQSMGFAVLGEVIAQASGVSCRQFLQDEFFTPLGMLDTTLGADDEWLQVGNREQRIAEIRLPEQQQGSDWGWNSRYWRGLGAPWGGLLTTPRDLAQFAQLMLREGRMGRRHVLAPQSVRAATRNQLDSMRDVPEVDRRFRPWGFGWRLHWPDHSASFGDLLSPRTYGHWGATGTVLWIDPDQDAFAILLSTQPQEPRGIWLARISNAISAAMT